MNLWIEGGFIFLVKDEDLSNFLTDCKAEKGSAKHSGETSEMRRSMEQRIEDRGQREDDFGLRIEKRHGAWSMGHGERKLAANSEQQAEEKGQRGDCGLETGSTG